MERNIETTVVLVEDLRQHVQARTYFAALGVAESIISTRPYPKRLVVTDSGRSYLDFPVQEQDPSQPNITLEELKEWANSVAVE